MLRKKRFMRGMPIEITIKNGDKLTITNINGKSISGEVTRITESAAEAMLFDTANENNFTVHHIELTPVSALPSSNLLAEVLTFSEAAEQWNIDASTLRHRVSSEKLIDGIDFKKSGKVWLITKNAMERLYGIK